MTKPELEKMDYLEIYDMSECDLMKYTKKQLCAVVSQLAHELYEMESNDD